jgi:PAS domain S-box-containing protein
VTGESSRPSAAERGLAAQYAAARILAEATTLEEAAPRLLEAICGSLDWDMGALLRLDQRTAVLRCVHFWHVPGVEVPEFQTFSEQYRFALGVGFPGRVWERGEPLWITDVTALPFPRAPIAAREGIRSAFGFPVLLGTSILGVLEFYMRREVRSPDPDVLDMMAALGSQIGQFIERKDAEAALRESEARKTAMLDVALDAIVTMDHEGKVLEFNQAAEALFGYARADVVGKELAELIVPPSLRARHRAGVARYLATGTGPLLGRRFELTGMRADGSEFPVELAIMPIRRDGLPFFTGYLRDITARKRAEEERAEFLTRERAARAEAETAERRAAFLAEASRVLASSLDYETTLASVAPLAVPDLADWCTIYLLADDGSLRITAIAHADPAKREWARDFTRRHPPGAGLLRVLAGERSQLFREFPPALLEAGARDAEEAAVLREFRSGMCIVLRARGRTLGVLLLISVDPTRLYAPADLEFAEELGRRVALAVDNARLYREARDANRLKDEFLATLSHELRTPLAAILSWSHLLRGGRLEASKAKRAVETIERNARTQARLVDDILDVSRIITGKLRLELHPIAVPAAIEAALEALRPAAEARGIRIRAALDADAGPVSGDPDRLQQVVWNLLSNAIKFTPRGGTVDVRLARVGSAARIEVRDTGQGIKADFLPYVFDRFRQADSTTTRAQGGLGLGLAIARHLVELHGGTIHAESAGEGQGATFAVSLPILAVNSRTDGALGRSREDGAPNLTGVRVLVVDDEADARELITTALELHGAQVTAAASAREALEALPRVRPTVLVSDIGMPGEDGYALIRQLRARGETLPAVALTAYAGAEDRTRVLRAGYQVHVVKTAEPTALAAAIARLTQAPSPD